MVILCLAADAFTTSATEHTIVQASALGWKYNMHLGFHRYLMEATVLVYLIYRDTRAEPFLHLLLRSLFVVQTLQFMIGTHQTNRCRNKLDERKKRIWNPNGNGSRIKLILSRPDKLIVHSE
jgi:hypothetical protein